MSDDKTKRAPRDNKRISLAEGDEVAYWTKRFGISKEKLTAAVRAVGRSAEAVERYLKARETLARLSAIHH